jgi:hypothetical protein
MTTVKFTKQMAMLKTLKYLLNVRSLRIGSNITMLEQNIAYNKKINWKNKHKSEISKAFYKTIQILSK